MNRKVIWEHVVEYLLLIFVLCLGYLILRFMPGVAWKVILIFSLGSFYLGYGSYHHFSEKDFRLSVLLEYLAVALMVIISLFVFLG